MTRIRTVDIETTGMEPPLAEVIEFAWWDVMTDGTTHRVSSDSAGTKLYRPDRPCPPEVMAVHHIMPEQLAHADRFSIASVAVTMDVTSPGPVDYYAAHNAEYEMRFISGLTDPEFVSPAPGWICTYKAALRYWPDAPSHGNQALMYWLSLHLELDDELRHPPHRALPDAYVTAHILHRLLSEGVSVDTLVEWSSEPRLLPTCPLGKMRGRKWPDVEYGFLTWMLKQADMESDLKWNAQRELDRRRTEYHRGG